MPAGGSESPAGSERLIVLDAVRGLAVMGILLINIVGFALPAAAYVNPATWGWDGWPDRVAWTVSQLLFEGRMRGLFALLFGAGILLVMDRADAGGASAVGVHLRRMAALALIGAAHLVFVWDGDILLHYALLGSVVWVARDWRPVRLVGVAATLLLIHTLYWSAFAGSALWLEHLAGLPGAAPATVTHAQAVVAAFPGPTNADIAAEVMRMRGDYAGILADRLTEAPRLPFDLMKLLGGETLGYMLLGMALFRAGFFTGGWNQTALRRLATAGYALGLPPLALVTWWSFASDFDPVVTYGNFTAWSVPFRVLVALGHLALAVIVFRRHADHPAAIRIAAVGRMSLSNYLATSIAMTTLFYGYGAAWFGELGRATLNVVVIAAWTGMLLWSRPWLARFRFGPAEWLWRSVACLRLQPLRGSAR